MNLRKQVTILTIMAAVVAGGWYAWTGGIGPSSGQAQSKEAPRKGQPATRVLVEDARPSQDRAIVRAIGTGEALRSATIYPKTAGEITSIHFKAQDRVVKGQLLLRLEDKHQTIAVRLARVEVKDAERQLKRLEKLAPSGTASQARLETAQTALETANLRLDQAEEALNDRGVYAPFDGIIGLTDLDTGDRVTTETEIATLDYRAEILVEYDLPEEYAGRVKIGDTLTVSPWTEPDKKIEGQVAQLGSRIDATARTLRVKAKIPNSDDTIRPGTSFAVEMAFKGKPYPSVREVAVLWSSDGAFLWRAGTVKNGKAPAEKVFVKIVRRDKGRILVDGAVKPGDPIVVEGVQGLRVGQLLRPEPFGNKAADSGPKVTGKGTGKGSEKDPGKAAEKTKMKAQ
ncbi:MAG: efflux RND transporter periplasmic adaptor subunit [Rhodospirillaceae bacterium]